MSTAQLSYTVETASYSASNWYTGSFRVGISGSSNYRSKLTIETGDLNISKSSRLVVQVTLNGNSSPSGTYAVLTEDGSFTPATVLSNQVYNNTLHQPSDALLATAIAESYPFEDAEGTTIHTGSNKPSGWSYYYVFNTDQLKAGRTYYIYVVRNIYSGCGSSSGYTTTNNNFVVSLEYSSGYTVRFESEYGQAPESMTVEAGYSLELPVLTAEGYRFKGWSETEGDSEGFTGEYYPAGSMTLYAVWTVLFTVTFDARGITDDPAAQTVEDGEYAYLPELYADGYEFRGWSEDPGTEYGDTGEWYPSASVTLYAVWLALYTVTYDANGRGEAPEAEMVAEGESLQLPSLELEGWSFLGWSEDPNAEDGMVGEYAPEASVTLYAVWLALYTVTYDARGVTDDPDAETINAGESILLPEMAADGYRFAGWSEDPEAAGGVTGVYEPESSVTLYAIWIALYTVTFNGNGLADDPEAVTVEAGAEVILPNMAADGYRFKGWSEDPDATEGMTGSFVPEYSVLLYAVWKKSGSHFSYYDGEKLISCNVDVIHNGEPVRCVADIMLDGKLVRL